MPLILASTSPYRKQLLERLKVPFDCVASDVDEEAYKKTITSPYELTKKLAFEKAHRVFQDHPNSVVIGGDQVSVLGHHILGKPHTHAKACEQLTMLAGQTHQLLTSVCILRPDTTPIEWTNVTKLTMKTLTSEQIDRYVKLDQPLNCAGSYKIESLGIALFEHIETQDFTAIMGLPLMKLSRHLSSI